MTELAVRVPLGAVAGGLLAGGFGRHAAALAGTVGVASATLWVLFSPIPRLRHAPGQDDRLATAGR